MNAPRKHSFLEAKVKLEALCAYQERCSFDLERRMIKWSLNQDERDRLIAHLISNNFLNEERFAIAYASGKVNIKKWGIIKIKLKLKEKRVSEYSITKGLDGIDKDIYQSNIEGLISQKVTQLESEENNYQRKMKVFRYLSSKGYTLDSFKDLYEDIISRDPE